MKTKTYEGLLSLHRYGDASDILFLSSVHEPLVDELGWIANSTVTVRYWITDTPCTKDQANDEFLKTLMGAAETEFHSRYSEYTGYLWTDETLTIGGHSLTSELRQAVNKWLILEITQHQR